MRFVCTIEQLVNLLTDMTSLPKAIATDEIVITSENQQHKQMSVLLSVTGLVPRALVPERKGLGSF